MELVQQWVDIDRSEEGASYALPIKKNNKSLRKVSMASFEKSNDLEEEKEEELDRETQTSSHVHRGEGHVHHPYIIIRRRDTTRTDPTASDFENRRYNFPLCGTSNYTAPIRVNDIVSIKIKSAVKVKVPFISTCDALSVAPTEILPVKYGSFTPKEEHLFRIVKIHTPSKFDALPIYIDGDKIIAKEVYEYYSTVESVPVSMIKRESLLDILTEERGCYFAINNEFLVKHESFLKENQLDSITSRRLKSWVDFIQEVHGKSSENCESPANEEKTRKKLLRLLPYTNHRGLLYPIEDEDDLVILREFFEVNEKFRDFITSIIGEEAFAAFGSYDQILNNLNQLYEALVALLGDHVDIRVSHTYECRSKLSKSLILPDLLPVNETKKLKYVDIFRVFKEDITRCLVFTETVTNWYGVMLPSEVRQELTVGNLVSN